MEIHLIKKAIDQNKIPDQALQGVYSELDKYLNTYLIHNNSESQDFLQEFYVNELSKLYYWEDLLKRVSSFEAIINMSIRYFKGFINKKLNELKSKEKQNALRQLKETLNRCVDHKDTFKSYRVSQKILLNNDARIYGDIKWHEGYSDKGIFQSYWYHYEDQIKSYNKFDRGPVSERNNGYSKTDYIEGTKRLLAISCKYLSPKKIFEGLTFHWLDFEETVVNIDWQLNKIQDMVDPAVKNDNEIPKQSSDIKMSMDVQRFFPTFLQIMETLSQKRRDCFISVCYLHYKLDRQRVDTIASRILGLNSGQDVRNNYEKAAEIIAGSLKSQDEKLIFSKSLHKYFEIDKLCDLIDTRIDELGGDI